MPTSGRTSKASSSNCSADPRGAAVADEVIATDALVIGAGPVGLFQVFQLGLLELKAHVVDSLPFVGGQCVELYADKPIYDIPGIPVCSARELVERLERQIAPFGAALHLAQEVSGVAPAPGGGTGFRVTTTAGTRFDAKVVVVAAGAGAFVPRPLKLAGIERFAGTQLHHRLPPAATIAGRDVVVIGDGDAALDTALALAGARVDGAPAAPASVTLLHRRDDFRAAPAIVARLRTALAAGALRFVAALPTAFDTQGGDGARLQALQVMGADGTTEALRADMLLVLQGLSPRLGPIASWGLALERRQLVVDSARFETSVPGVYAVGDIVDYPGKKKLIVCGFHEATLAAWAAAERIFGDRTPALQYTTTSPRLHALLGVAGGDAPAP